MNISEGVVCMIGKRRAGEKKGKAVGEFIVLFCLEEEGGCLVGLAS